METRKAPDMTLTLVPDAPAIRRPAAYGRNSKAMTKSISDQITIGIGACRALHEQDPVVYSDSTSASKYRRVARGGWDRIVADVDAGAIDWLWLWEPSRGSREAWEWLKFLELCAQRGVLIHIHSHGRNGRTYDPDNRRDWKTLADEGLEADNDSRKTSERVLRGKSEAAEAGRPVGHVSYGYRRLYDPNSGDFVRQEIDDKAREWGSSPAAIVRRIFADAHRGRPISEIVAELNAKGIPSPRAIAAAERPSKKALGEYDGLRWNRSPVRAMLTNRAYLGERMARGELAYANAWPALIEPEIFHAVGALMSDPKRRRNKSSKARHLLTHIAVCGQCDHVLVAGTYGARTKPRLRCNHGYHSAAPMQLIDVRVTAWICDWIARPGRLAALRELEGSDEAKAARADADRLRTELKQWEAQLDDPDSPLSPAEYARRKQAIVGKLTEAEGQAMAASAYATAQEFTDADSDVGKVARIWGGLSLYRRRDIVRELVEVRLYPAGKGDMSSASGELSPGRLVITARVEV
jgi:DNA invertase Pin-like site-specific DNA recombinase